jgi:uncharacterized membrane protein YkoI
MLRKISMLLCLTGLSLIMLDNNVRADVTTEAEAIKIATTEYPGKVLAVRLTESDEGRKEYEVEVRSGIYHRKVIVDAERERVDRIYYRRDDGGGWTAKKVPLTQVLPPKDNISTTDIATPHTLPLSAMDARQVALARYPGKVVSCIGPQDRGDGPSYRVMIRNGNILHTVDVLTETGKVSRVRTASIR